MNNPTHPAPAAVNGNVFNDLADRPAAGQPRVRSAAAVAMLARDQGSRRMFPVAAVIAVAVYALLLPAIHTKHVSPTNWGQLNGDDVVFSVALGVTMAAVLTVQTLTWRTAAAHRRTTGGKAALGGAGFLASVTPGLCCTAVLPAVLGAFGVGAAGGASTMHAVAPLATPIQLASLALLLTMLWWSLRRLATACTTSCAVVLTPGR